MFQRRSESEANDKFLPDGRKGHLQRVVEECVEQFAMHDDLSHKQRVSLFKAVITYMFKFAEPRLAAKYIQNITVHTAMQAIMDLLTEQPEITMEVEPFEGVYSIH